MGFFDFFRRGSKRGTDGGSIDGPESFDLGQDPLEEPGEGGPSVLMPELAALRWAAQQEAVNVGRMPLEPELWDGGRLAFSYERHLAQEHEGLRDRLADFVSAESRDSVRELYEIAGDVGVSRDELRAADRELAVNLHSWNRAYREVHEDELELGRYFRMKSVAYQLFKWLIGALLFAAELAVSVALFSEIIEADVPALPFVFAMGLILILIVVPHYSAIGIKDGVTKYHEAELDAWHAAGLQPPAKLRKKARLEEAEDSGIKIAAAVVGLVLVGLVIPLSSLRARELGGDEAGWFWFFFFLLLQVAISGYFFLREWLDYGPAAVNLKYHDESKLKAERKRHQAFDTYAANVADFTVAAQDLLFLYRQAPRWDSHIVQSYLATIHYFRHVVSLHQPDLAVFITHATTPYLETRGAVANHQSAHVLDPVSAEHLELAGRDAFSREWWLIQVNQALQDATVPQAVSKSSVVDGDPAGEPDDVAGAPKVLASDNLQVFESPANLLDEFLRLGFGLDGPYERPAVLDHIAEVDEDIEPHAQPADHDDPDGRPPPDDGFGASPWPPDDASGLSPQGDGLQAPEDVFGVKDPAGRPGSGQPTTASRRPGRA